MIPDYKGQASTSRIHHEIQTMAGLLFLGSNIMGKLVPLGSERNLSCFPTSEGKYSQTECKLESLY